LAVIYSHDVVIKLLLDIDRVALKFKDIKYGWTPLLWLAERGNIAVVKKLLKINGVDLDSKFIRS
jgi:ankyrin repeat protein